MSAMAGRRLSSGPLTLGRSICGAIIVRERLIVVARKLNKLGRVLS